MAKRSWNEYRELVLHELDRFQKWLEELTDKQGSQKDDGVAELAALRAEIDKLRNEVTAIKVRISIYAALAGGLVSAVVWAIKVFAGLG